MLLGHVSKRKEAITSEVQYLENKKERQEKCAQFVTSKARDAIKSEIMKVNEEKVKEESILHLVRSMDFIVKSEKMLIKDGIEENDLKLLKGRDELRLVVV